MLVCLMMFLCHTSCVLNLVLLVRTFLFREIDLWRFHFRPPCLRRIGALGRVATTTKQERMSPNKVGEQECLHRVLISCVLHLLGGAQHVSLPAA